MWRVYLLVALRAVRAEHCQAVLDHDAECPASLDDAGSAVALLQYKRRQFRACGTPPHDLQNAIASNQGVLMIAVDNMRCTLAAKGALDDKGVPYTFKGFDGDFMYTPGQSDVWDWLHCTYPDDKQGPTVMHSYVFVKDKFIGQGFAAATKIQSGAFDADILDGASQSCEERFPSEDVVLQGFMSNSSTRVLLFGWLSCPCTGIAQGRFSELNLCYESRIWANPQSSLMKFLQCRQGDSSHHSFVYFSEGNSWKFIGNGFAFDEKDMTKEELQSLVDASGAKETCEQASIKRNVFGTTLHECRVGDDSSGSWMDDGTCSEQMGGIHEICIEQLPADFSTETRQPPWSKDRAGKRHCVCIGAWSLYMTEATSHIAGAEAIMPHCDAIPETALTKRYLDNWKDWNGNAANIVLGVRELVSRCLAQQSDEQLKCGLKVRFDQLAGDAPELQKSDVLKDLRADFEKLECA